MWPCAKPLTDAPQSNVSPRKEARVKATASTNIKIAIANIEALVRDQGRPASAGGCAIAIGELVTLPMAIISWTRSAGDGTSRRIRAERTHRFRNLVSQYTELEFELLRPAG